MIVFGLALASAAQALARADYRLSGVGAGGLRGPPSLSAYVQEPTRSALGSCWRRKGHLVALLGSLNNSRMTV
jgi:hypothetical protein